MRRPDLLLTIAVAVAAVAAAAALYADHAVHADQLWRGVYADRHSHFGFGLDLALAAGTLDPVWFFSELEKAKVWPPLHGLVLAVTLLVGGIDHRLGIVPSLAGWVLTIVCVWLIARGMFTARRASLVAGSVAAALTAASPAFRLLSSDVLLEGLGAGLSALTLVIYGWARTQPGNALRWRALALVLTALFFHKGNYWGLVAAALIVSAVAEDWRRWLGHAGRAWRSFAPAMLLRQASRDPWMWLFAAIAATVAFLYIRGPTVLPIGRGVSLYPPENLVTAAYAVLFIRVTLAWRHRRAALDAALGVPGRCLFYWHVVPVAVSFLLPKRLSAFLWFVGPFNSSAALPYDPWRGVLIYGDAFIEAFHGARWIALLSLALFAVALPHWRRFPPAGRAALALALLSFVAVVLHPQHQGRFLASWIFAVWIGAGAGAAIVLEWVTRRWPQLWATSAAAAAVLALVAALAAQPPPAAAYVQSFRVASGPSDLDLVRPYLSALDGPDEIMFAATFGNTRLFAWMLHERCRCNRAVRHPWIVNAPSREAVRQLMANEIAETTAERIVVIDAPRSAHALPELGWVYERMAGIVDAMASQDRFTVEAVVPLPDHGAEVTIWRRRAKPAKPS